MDTAKRDNCPTPPKGEFPMVTIGNAVGTVRFLVTAKEPVNPSSFSIFELQSGTWARLGKGNNPSELQDKYVDFDKLRKETV